MSSYSKAGFLPNFLPDADAIPSDDPAAQAMFALNALREMTESKKLSDSQERFASLLESLGYSGFVFGALFRDGADMAFEPILMRGAMTPVTEMHAHQNLIRGDPIIARAYRAAAPFTWAEFYRQREAADEPGARAVIENLLAHGVTCGATFPSASPGSMFHAVLSVSGPAGMTSEAFETQFWRTAWLARAAATLLKDLMLKEVIDSRVSRLTPSEVAVMNELAKGLRPQQIAQIFGKSEKTIRNQITSAKARLGARTRDQALSYALGFGLIQP
ncbi:helix-turn-helix transcriptional regulator [Oceanicella actignis]|uniref:Regulatory protein, luxR family n=1 Tax=Oceanicella actignis TaxID=1189325 RepID=A0A1M7SDL1_9RHOB|nr:autoinducer binding domain-containing protein [Oceanicella actignis]TYO91405.1 regulatory LuxR family protein [Oceanicella actignis]SET25783.1 regulatory protein, luxR family [Oceanicella actignis]SHN56322.1 regulatory protein, luxR family [Oceanicella actignis]